MGVFTGSLIPKVELAFCASCGNCNHFLSECHGLIENFDSLWDKLKTKARDLNPVDGDQIVNFNTKLNRHNEMLLLLRGLQLPFNNITTKSKDLLLQLLDKFTRFSLKSCMR